MQLCMLMYVILLILCDILFYVISVLCNKARVNIVQQFFLHCFGKPIYMVPVLEIAVPEVGKVSIFYSYKVLASWCAVIKHILVAIIR